MLSIIIIILFYFFIIEQEIYELLFILMPEFTKKDPEIVRCDSFSSVCSLLIQSKKLFVDFSINNKNN